jgi:choline dehydrogenase-like flavoprotein
VNNLYLVDGSFFVSSGAVNPTLTIIANALRVGDHLLEQFGTRCGTTVRDVRTSRMETTAAEFAMAK